MEEEVFDFTYVGVGGLGARNEGSIGSLDVRA